MTKLMQWFLAAALLLACVADSAREETSIFPPSDWNTGRIFVGRRLSDGTSWVGYVPGLSGAPAGLCRWHLIGDDNGLYDDKYRVYGGEFNDEATVLGGEPPFTTVVCGVTMGVLHNFGGGIKLYMLGGNDVVLVSSRSARVSVDGGWGNDVISAINAANLYGGPGPDGIFCGTGTSMYMYGNEETDLLCSYGSPRLMDGGTGAFDANYGTGVVTINFDTTAPQSACENGIALVNSRVTD